MLLFSNQVELKQMDPDFFSDLSIISTEVKKITMFVFINKIMSKVYKLIHNIELPRVLEEMKNNCNLVRKIGQETGFFTGIIFLLESMDLMRCPTCF